MPRNETIRINVELDLKRWIEQRAQADGLSVSSWIRFVLVRAREKGMKRDNLGIPRVTDMEGGVPTPPAPTDARSRPRKKVR